MRRSRGNAARSCQGCQLADPLRDARDNAQRSSSAGPADDLVALSAVLCPNLDSAAFCPLYAGLAFVDEY